MKQARYIILLVTIAMSCTKNNDPPMPEVNKDPIGVQLEFPLKNSECTTGLDQGADKTLVEFRWAVEENDSYELVLENLSTDQTIRTSTNNHSVEVQLDKNTPYRWYVISNVSTSNSEVESERWMFYAAGEGVSNYAPFPADLISPENEAKFNEDIQELTFEWQSSDIDDDSISYDVFVGSQNPPVEIVASDLTEPTFKISTQFEGQMYWQIVTKDPNGNSSNSKVGTFGIGEETGFVSFEIQEEGYTYSAFFDPDGDEIRIQLGNFDYEKLAPKIEMKDGYSVNPASGETFNFHDDLFYIVTDPEGNETVYNVMVESGQHEIKSFIVRQGDELYRGMIDSDDATITIEMGNFDYTNIAPEIELSNKASIEVSQISNMNLTMPATFTVVSEIGTTKEFTVKAPLAMTYLRSYFWNPGFEFAGSVNATGYKVLAGSTHYLTAFNVQNSEQVNLQLIDMNGNIFAWPIVRDAYSHQHSFETSLSSNRLTAEIPSDLPGGEYTVKITEGLRSKHYPQSFEVINDDRVIRITKINKTNFVRGDTLIMNGVNLKRDLMIKSDANQYIFNNYSRDLTVNEDGTELRLIFSTNVYGNLKSWGGTNEKPLSVQTAIEGYPHKLSSNIVYFNVN